MVDDRLGEVIYRQNKINLEDLIQAAGKVTPELKFGQVLLDASILDNLGLWESLNLQVIRIVNSIFMQESLYIEIYPIPDLNFQIFVKSPTQDILDSSYSYGYALQYFKGLIHPEDVLIVDSELSVPYGVGTFLGDFISLILQAQNVGSLLKSSSLNELYTLDVLVLLLRLGVCSIKNKLIPPPLNELNTRLRTKILGYTRLLETVENIFALEGKTLPLRDITQMVKGVDNEVLPVLFLDDKARLRKSAETFLMAQAMVSKKRSAYFESCFDYLLKLIIVLAQDRLPKKRVEEACLSYKELIQ